MQTLTQLPFAINQARLESMRESLRDSFGTDFTLWIFEERWWQIPLDPDGEYLPASDTESEQLSLARGSSPRPQCFEIDGTDRLLVLPQRKIERRVCAATAKFRHAPASLIERLAQQYLKSQSNHEENVRLRQEHEGFLRQVTNDFEELTFLRSMANLLEISDLTVDLVSMGRAMLPTLKPLVDSDALVLVPAIDGQVIQSTSDNLSCVWCGAQCITEATCLRLVSQYREAATNQPIVKNYFDQTEYGPNFPNLHSFIMVQIVSGEVIIGWLLALNRNNERNLNAEQLPWELSYLEFGTHEATLMSSSAAILATHSRNVQLFREREDMLVSVVRALVSAVEAKDEYTCGHSERVALFGKCIAEEMGYDAKYCERLYLTGLLHDVGKIGIRDAVLRKPGPLTDEEFEEIKQHPVKGWQIMQELLPLNYVLNGILHHHEQFDGRGYPDKLIGLQIPLDGRILAVADAYDAMTSDRPYRKGMAQEKAESILRSGAGKQWDVDIITAFFECLPRILEIKANYQPRLPRQRKEPSSALADR